MLRGFSRYLGVCDENTVLPFYGWCAQTELTLLSTPLVESRVPWNLFKIGRVAAAAISCFPEEIRPWSTL